MRAVGGPRWSVLAYPAKLEFVGLRTFFSAVHGHDPEHPEASLPSVPGPEGAVRDARTRASRAQRVCIAAGCLGHGAGLPLGKPRGAPRQPPAAARASGAPQMTAARGALARAEARPWSVGRLPL